MASLDDYAAYVAVVDSGSLTAASRRLGRSLQTVSRVLAALERELGVELISRTTRQCHPTEAGLRFYGRIKTVLADFELARAEAVDAGGVISGRLRLAAPNQFGVIHLMPAIASFMERHTAVKVDLLLDDRLVDPLAERLDLMVRFGEPADSTLRARRLGSARRVIFGAPGYFARHGRPRKPEDLATHQCIVRTAVRGGDSWKFLGRKNPLAVKVGGRFRADTAAGCNEAAISGLGIARTLLYQIRPLLDQGRAELVLEDFPQPTVPIHLLWPATTALPARSRALIDFLAARLAVERI